MGDISIYDMMQVDTNGIFPWRGSDRFGVVELCTKLNGYLMAW